MKRIINSIMRRLDLRLTRASSFERLVAHAAASERKYTELEGRLAAVLDAKATDRSRESGTQPIGHILAKIPGDGAISTQTFAAICADFSALTTASARDRVSEQLLAAMLAGDLAQSDFQSAPALKSLSTHELYRQVSAARSFALGRLDESSAAWKQIGVDLPSAFNLACHARVLAAQDNRKDAFAVLADAVERYPGSVLLATELALFFMRLGDVDAANVALVPVRHAFLDERSALTSQQAELDRAIDEGRTGNGAQPAAQPTARVHVTEFQNPTAVREAAVRKLTTRIVGDSAGAITRTIEAGPATLTDEAAGSRVLLLQSADAENCYPASLLQFYRRCRERGINHLVVGELVDFDRDSLCFHAPGRYPRLTRLGGGGRFLHDYGKLLADAGYAIVETVNVQPTLAPALGTPDPGYRLLRVVHRAEAEVQA